MGTEISLREILRMMSEIAGYEIKVKVKVKVNHASVRPNETPRLRGSNVLLQKLVLQVYARRTL